MSAQHRWNFFRAGGFWQAEINDAADVAAISSLDRKLWAALACPVSGTNFDKKTLEFIDGNCDGFIRADELVNTINWIMPLLKSPNSLFEIDDALALSDINENSADGKILLSTAREILKVLGKEDADKISLADVSDKTAIFANTEYNADGIITEKSCDSQAKKALLSDIIKTCGAKKDLSGNDGVDRVEVAEFYSECKSFSEWSKSGENYNIDAYEKFASLEAKLDDFFVRCEFIAFQPESERILRDYVEKIAAGMGERADLARLLSLPAAKINGQKILKLSEANPAYADEILALLRILPKNVVTSKKDEITISEWKKIKFYFAPCKDWKCKNISKVSILGARRVNEILSTFPESEFDAIFERESSLKDEVANIEQLEKLVRIKTILVKFLDNFVNFTSFYDDSKRAAFQFGKLFIGGLECNLCIRVNDVAKHASMAPLSYTFLAYCLCKRAGENDVTIAVAITSGRPENITVGKNGIFYDNIGREWGATVIKVIDNPISLTQAFWAPYKRFANWAGTQLTKLASASDDDVSKSLQNQTNAKNLQKKIDVGTVAALGVAVSGLTAALGLLLESFFGLGAWMPLGIIAIILAISLPSVIIAAMKLKNRNVAPLLDANGWAVNTRAKISIWFGGRLTKTASLPPHSKKTTLNLSENPKVKKIRRGLGATAVLFALLLGGIFSAWYYGRIEIPFVPESSYVKNLRSVETKANSVERESKKIAIPTKDNLAELPTKSESK